MWFGKPQSAFAPKITTQPAPRSGFLLTQRCVSLAALQRDKAGSVLVNTMCSEPVP